MSRSHTIRGKGAESGVALLLAIFVLLLVAVVGIAMMAASGTETSLSANYRSSTSAYYAALSGLEEGRARLLPKNSNYLGNTSPPAIPPIGTSLPLGQLVYIVNPAPSEAFDTTSIYPDTEYSKDFPSPPSGSPQLVASVASYSGQPNALYKWVRINAVDEWALEVDVNNTNPSSTPSVYYGSLNKPQIVRFDGTNLTRAAAPYQALQITSLAALPDGSRKLLQYVVGPVLLRVPVDAALTFTSGNSAVDAATFTPPVGLPPGNTTSFYVRGDDQCNAKLPLPAVGVANSYDYTSVSNAINPPYQHPDHFTNGASPTPSLSNVSPNIPMVVDMTDPISLSNFVTVVRNAADTVLNGPRTEGDMPPAVSIGDASFPNNPQTVFVDGDLSLTGYTGYGLLVVRGNLTYTGNSGWKGIVIVLGGTMTETGSLDGGEFDGAVYVLNLLNSGGGPTSLGQPTFNVGSPGGFGIHYNSCWVTTAQKPLTYKVISFREIPYP